MTPLNERLNRWTTGGKGLLSILLLTIFTWLPTLHQGVNSVDSIWLVRDNPLLNGSAGSGPSAILHTILFDFSLDTRLVLGAEYLPVRDLSVWADFALFGDNFAFHHLGNLFWYCLSITGVFLICVRLFSSGRVAWITTLLFAMHPTHVESVAWLASRKDLLGFSLFTATILLFLSSRFRGTLMKTALLIPVLTLASIWSKNTSVILPGVLVVASILFLSASIRSWRWWLSWLPLGVVALCTTALSTTLGSRVGIYAEPRASGVVEAISLQGSLFLHYFEKLIAPFGLAPFYSEPESLSVGAIVGFTIAIGLMGTALILRKRSPVYSLGVAILFLGLVPVSMLVPLQNLITDRYLLIPSLGFCLILGAALTHSPSRFQGSVYLTYLAIISTFAIQTNAQATLWQDEGALWSHNIEVEPHVARGWSLLAKHQQTNGEIEEALSTLSNGLETIPDNPGLLQSRGAIYLTLGQLEMAEQDLRLALDIDSNRREAAHNLATLLMRTNRNQEAALVADKLVEAHPQYPAARNTFGAILLNIGELDSAEEQLLVAEAMIWEDAEVACNLGSIGWLKAQESEGDAGAVTDGREMARRWWTECLERDSSMSYAAQGLAALSNLQ